MELQLRIGTCILYNAILTISFIFVKRSKTKKWIFAAYCLLLLLSSFRFTIGNDYENLFSLFYYSNLEFSGAYSYSFENVGSAIVPILVSIVPDHSKVGASTAIGFLSLIFLFYIYKTLDRYKVHDKGIILLFILSILFQSWDWAKQCAAVAIFIYSTKYIEDRNFKKYVIYIIIASLFHISALITLPLYYLSKIYISPRLLSFSLFIVFIMTELGLFHSIHERLVGLIPYYNEVYAMSQYSYFDQYTYYSPRFIYTSLWYIVVLLLCPSHIKIYPLIFAIGATLYMVSSGSLLLDRISLYFTISQLIIVPLELKLLKKKSIGYYLLTFMLLVHAFLFNREIFIDGGLRGSDIYQSVFSEDYDHLKFRDRTLLFVN